MAVFLCISSAGSARISEPCSLTPVTTELNSSARCAAAAVSEKFARASSAARNSTCSFFIFIVFTFSRYFRLRLDDVFFGVLFAVEDDLDTVRRGAV